MTRARLEAAPQDRPDVDEHEHDDEEDPDDISGVLGESGLTEEDRRQVRKEQRQLMKDLSSDQADDIEEARARNNKIWKRVRYTREAVLDGSNVSAIANKAVRKVDRLVQVPRYDAHRLVHKLVEKIHEASAVAKGGRSSSHSSFDWEILGEAAGACFNAIPSGACFLNGPLTNGQPPISRKGQVRRRHVTDDDAKEERPEDVKGHTEKNEDKLSAIEKSMTDMAKMLKKKVDKNYLDGKRSLAEAHNDDIPGPVLKKFKRHGTYIDAVQFLLNPKSFTQSIENIFHFSFLIKKGAAAVSLREKALDWQDTTTTTTDENGNTTSTATQPGLVLKYTKERDDHPPARQGIMTLNMRDWRNLCQSYQVESGDLPHRKLSKQAHAQSLSQASNH